MSDAYETLISFFDFLAKDDFDNAIKLCSDDWEILDSFRGSEQESNAEALKNYCSAVGTCLKAELLDADVEEPYSLYSVVVQFREDDGSIFVLGPCCGETEETMPSQKQFTFQVMKINGAYKVITPPLYRP